jgi:hypothetical protein
MTLVIVIPVAVLCGTARVWRPADPSRGLPAEV